MFGTPSDVRQSPTSSGRPPLKTPFRPKYATAASTSSSSSSSTTSSIFDEGLSRLGTPLTPPTSETPDSRRPRLLSYGKLSTTSFVGRCVDARDISLLVEGVKKLNVQDGEQTSNTRGSPGVEKPPAPARSPQSRKGRQAVQRDSDKTQSSMESEVSNPKRKHQSTSRTDKTPSADQKVHLSLNLTKSKVTPRSIQSGSAENPTLDITIDGEGKELDLPAQNLPHPLQYQQQGTLSPPQASHKRSASAPSSHIIENTPIDTASVRDASPTHTNEVDAVSPIVPKGCRSRRRSTGSIEPEQTVLPSIERPTCSDDDKLLPGTYPTSPITFPDTRPPSTPSESHEKTTALHPNDPRTVPKLTHMHPQKKSPNALKTSLLHLILRRKSKPSVAASQHGYIYIFSSPRFPGHVKIGSTIKAPETRILEWGTACKFTAVQVTDANNTAFRFCRIVEAIVHAELYNERRKFACERCMRKGVGMRHRLEVGGVKAIEHGEWFEVSERRALDVVGKWREWMVEKEPYGEDAVLRARWVWKCEVAMRVMRGTEEEWVAWRGFGWEDAGRLVLYDFGKWLGEVVPLLRKLSPVSVVVLGALFWVAIVGVGWVGLLMAVVVLLLYLWMCFKFC